MKNPTPLLTLSTFAIALACAVLLVVLPPAAVPGPQPLALASLR